MCDWSAESAKRRDAAVHDQLIVAEISRHTKGLVSPEDRQTAVCLLSGSHVIVSELPVTLQEAFGVGDVATATFEQRQPQHGYGCRDGIVFDGSTLFVRFQDLPLGLQVSVETIPGQKIFEEVRPLELINI